MPSSFDQDYQDFLKSEETSPPQDLVQKVSHFIKIDLNPSHIMVFLKLLSIQAFVGLLTLLFCPQFNLSLTNNFELFHYFHHRFGENICMVICGSIFMGSGAIFASYILKMSEIRKIKNSPLLYYTAMSSVAIMSFLSLGAQMYLQLAIYWFLGSSLSGVVLFKVNTQVRRHLL